MKKKHDGYEYWKDKKLNREIQKLEKSYKKAKEKELKKGKRMHTKGHRNNNTRNCSPHVPQYKKNGLIL